MDLRQLEILRAVAESGSFTGAGRRLHVSQSAVSRQILLLEAELNEPLFWRIKRKVRITPTGEALLQLAIRVFQDIKETTASITETQEKLTGSVRLVGGHDRVALRLPGAAEGVQAAASRGGRPGDHRIDRTAAAQAALRRGRSRA